MTVDSEDYRPEGFEGPGDPLPRDMPDQQAGRQEADEDDDGEASPEPPDAEESPEPGESPG